MANSGMITLRFEDRTGDELYLEISKDLPVSNFTSKLIDKIKEKKSAKNKFKNFNIRLFMKRNIMKNYEYDNFLNPEFVDLELGKNISVGKLVELYGITEETTIKYFINEIQTHFRAPPCPFYEYYRV